VEPESNAVGVATTTRHAFAAPRRLGSIPARVVRRTRTGARCSAAG
jgi:hypothetical protein